VSALTIARESPGQPDVVRLIGELDAYQAALYPAESNHFLDLAALAAPDVRFFVARAGGEAVGCGAVRIDPEGYAEVKRMFVLPRARGMQLGKRLLQRLEEQARDEGCRWLRLETGIHQPEALGLYRAVGFAERGPFGDYRPDPLSVFMEKPLPREAPDAFGETFADDSARPPSTPPTIAVREANLGDAADGAALVEIIDSYARGPGGQGRPLSEQARAGMVRGLREHPWAFALLAFADGRPAGAAVCIWGFSTFAGQPYVNVHDLAVLPDFQDQGLGTRLLDEVERRARARGCCKITLEVHDTNHGAKRLYERVGFGPWQSPTLFVSKSLAPP
jgi:putative acetyltransferase